MLHVTRLSVLWSTPAVAILIFIQRNTPNGREAGKAQGALPWWCGSRYVRFVISDVWYSKRLTYLWSVTGLNEITVFDWILYLLSFPKSYLYNRRARVSVDRIHSKKILPGHGVPQGGVLSPSLFLLFISDLVSELPKGVEAALYADNLAIWCKEEYATTATYRMQLAVNKLNSWTEKWCVAVSKDKSSSTLFTLSPQQKVGIITLDGAPLKEDEEATYLGITFDKRQTWKQHIAKAEAKARRRLAILRKLAGTTWGASEKIPKTVYQGTVRPHLEYGSSAWSTTAKTNQQALDKVQYQALRLITGAMRSTPITEMERLTGVQPLGQRRDGKNIMQAEKFKCLTNHHVKTRLEGLTKNRLKETVLSMTARSWSASFTTDCPRAHFPSSHQTCQSPG